MASARLLSTAMALALALQAPGILGQSADGLRLRSLTLPAESPVGGHLTVRELVVDGRSLGWKELVEYGGVLYAPESFLGSLGLKPRRGALSVFTRFERWYSLDSIPGVAVQYTLNQRRVSLLTGGMAGVPAEAPIAGTGLRLKPSAALGEPPAASIAATQNAPSPAAESRTAVPETSPPPPVSVLPTAPPATTRLAGTTGERLLPLEVRVNGSKAGTWLLLEKGGDLYATPDAFDEWRLTRDETAKGIEFRDRVWYPLGSIAGYQAEFNFAEQSVDLNFRASAFGATRVTAPAAQRPVLSPVLTSFFLNYDINRTQTDGRDFATRRDLGALMELGYSSSLGVLTSSYLGRNLENDENIDERSWRRLETTLNRDFPDRNLTLRIGDSSTRAGMWGRQVYFGGIQLGRNFALTPGFVTYPLPIVAGQSSAPSTVELYVNDVLRQTSQVPTGPFAIDNFPLVTGSGQARVVVRDVLGRETVLLQNFFSSAELLDAGLSDWSAEIGAVRENLGIENADYGQAFASGLWRYGLNRRHTLEARAEVGDETRGAGLGLSIELPWQMLGQIGAAGSRNGSVGNGGHGVAGVQHASLRHGFTFRVEGSSREYRQIGTEAVVPARRQTSASYSSYNFIGDGSLGIGYAQIERFDQEPLKTASINYTMRLGARSSVTFSASRSWGAADSDTVGVSLLIPFDDRISVTGNVIARDNSTDGYLGASQGLGAEIGTGWRALAGKRSGIEYGEGGIYYQGSRTVLTADLNATSDIQTTRLGAQGALIAADGSLFATRKLQNSFAVVEVAGYENVGVGFQSSIYARTDKAGRAIVPNLQAYRPNSIRLDPNELPISAEIDSIEQVAVPAARSGVKVNFPVRSGRGALIKIQFEDGEAAPAGSVVNIKGDAKEFYVARRGESFVTGLQSSNVVRLHWKDQSCDLQIDLPPGSLDDIARVGPVVCAGVKR